MRVIVCGGRDFSNVAFIWRELDKLHEARPFTAFMHGGAKGADAIASEWSKTKAGLERYVCHADWEKHGRAAGPIRNQRMMEWKPDLVIAFPDPKSRGTYDMAWRARKAGVETIVYDFETGRPIPADMMARTDD